MEFKQPNIDFNVHLTENNVEMQAHLEENRIHFSSQCTKVFNLLMSGEKLTVLNAITNYGISSLPRRCLDLAINGVKITNNWVKPDSGVKYKVWYMNEADKEANKKFFNK